MSKITQIDGRSAAVAWSPLNAHSDVLAIGTKVRGFEHKYREDVATAYARFFFDGQDNQTVMNYDYDHSGRWFSCKRPAILLLQNVLSQT